MLQLHMQNLHTSGRGSADGHDDGERTSQNGYRAGPRRLGVREVNQSAGRSGETGLVWQLAMTSICLLVCGLRAQTTPNAIPNTQIEAQRLLDVEIYRLTQFDNVLRKHGWDEIAKFFKNDVLKPYIELNASQLQVDTSGFNEQQVLFHQQQLKPVLMNPKVIGNYRKRLEQIDADLKLIDESLPLVTNFHGKPTGSPLSVFTNPETKHVAEGLNREYEDDGGGYIQSMRKSPERAGLGSLAAVALLAGLLCVSMAMRRLERTAPGEGAETARRSCGSDQNSSARKDRESS
jgi:hypothetical protein